MSEQLARHEPIDFDPAVSSRPLVLENRADEKSKLAFIRVQEAMQAWEKAILRARLNRANLPVSLPTPINPEVIDLAQDDQLAANLWSKLFPALLIIMAATGAFYPAIDLGAGEKERGTMETLLISPAKRTEIVLGKFLTVLVFSVVDGVIESGQYGFYRQAYGQCGRNRGSFQNRGSVVSFIFGAVLDRSIVDSPVRALQCLVSVAGHVCPQ